MRHTHFKRNDLNVLLSYMNLKLIKKFLKLRHIFKLSLKKRNAFLSLELYFIYENSSLAMKLSAYEKSNLLMKCPIYEMSYL